MRALKGIGSSRTVRATWFISVEGKPVLIFMG
jgi:hypothetical protein